MSKKQEHHFVVVYDTETKRWYTAAAGDFFPAGYIWDKETGDWVDWDETYAEEEYNKNAMFLEQTLRDFNMFVDAYGKE